MMDQPSTGGVRELHAMGDGDTLTAECGGLYQAGYDAGYAKGREDGYRAAYHECGGGPRQNGSSNLVNEPAVASSAMPTRRRGLLALPCERCGTFLYSDEPQCPRCKTKVIGR
jgi:hypothetical protein